MQSRGRPGEQKPRHLDHTVAVGSAFALGRASVPDGLLSRSKAPDLRIVTFSGGALGAGDVRGALAGAADLNQRRAAVEQLVRARLLAQEAEAADLEMTHDFLRSYSEELARVQLDKAFEEPFKKKLPTEEELRKFFDENQAKLGRPERVRLAHLALLAPRSEDEARTRKRAEAQRLLAEIRRTSKDEYAFGRLALTRSEDPRSRPAAGELPFATREEIEARLGQEAAEVAFSAPPGRVVDRVVETEQGFQIVKVIARETGREASYDELRDPIRARLTAERREKAFKEFMDALWARSDVTIDDAALKQFVADGGKSEGTSTSR
jgi:parvulin-like peptidyl-prolyl isomerase